MLLSFFFYFLFNPSSLSLSPTHSFCMPGSPTAYNWSKMMRYVVTIEKKVRMVEPWMS